MTDILIDRTTKTRHILHRCFKCDHVKYPRGRVIMPYDKRAIHSGTTHICGVCATEMNRKIVEGMSSRPKEM
jgi:hypothetical protein